jgi:hypothetical protein
MHVIPLSFIKNINRVFHVIAIHWFRQVSALDTGCANIEACAILGKLTNGLGMQAYEKQNIG